MKRLFIMAYLITVVTFFVTVIVMDQSALFSTDEWDERNLKENISATNYLLEDIAQNSGQDHAEEALKNFADQMELTLKIYDPMNADAGQELSVELQKKVFEEKIVIEDAEENLAYFTFGNGQHIYKVEINSNSELWLEEGRLELMTLIEICAALAIIIFIVLFMISRRLRRLEDACIAFADGDLDVRAPTKMRHQVGNLNYTFNFMAERISQLIRSNRNLTNAVAHEFRTPIFRIQCNLDMLDDSQVRNEQMPYLEGMQGDLNELCSMVEELLHFSKMERLDTQLTLEETDIHALMDKQLSHLQFETDKKLTLEADNSCIAPISVRLFQRAVGNIIRNGYKYAESEVRILLQTSPTELHIRIENDGPNIPVEYRESIFEPFIRLDKARDRQSGGHGLGLAITKQIIKQHNGSIYISDSMMGGVCFNIKLPLLTTSS